jgi:hypothetical protein
MPVCEEAFGLGRAPTEPLWKRYATPGDDGILFA